MKKRILIILLAFVMMFSCLMIVACNSSSDWEKEIDMTVEDDSNVPEPTYSTKFKQSLEDSIVDLFSEFGDLNRRDVKEAMDEVILPLCQKAKVSEKNLNSIINYYKSNKNKILELQEIMVGDEMPNNVESFYRAYYALLKGAIEVLNADDVGKLMYEAMQNEDMPWYEEEAAIIASDIGRDNFIIVSRFAFKLMNVSLEKQEGMIDLMMSVMNMALVGGIYDESDVVYAELVELYLMDIEMMYEVYQTVTDSEINKLIEICVDTYASVSKVNGKTLKTAEKNELKTKCKNAAADCRPVVTLIYKTSKRLNKTTLANYIKDEDETIAYYAFSAMLDAYEKDLTAAEKTRISDMLKDILTNAQYYEEDRVEYDTYYSYSSYDYDAEEYIYYYYVEYRITMVKTSEKQFIMPAEYLSDPIALLKVAKTLIGKEFGGLSGKLTQKEQSLLDLLEDNRRAIGMAIYVRLGIPTDDIYDSWDYDYIEVRESAIDEGMNCEG